MGKFLQNISKEVVSVELKNGTVISGLLISTDIGMNIHMKNVNMTVKHQNPINLESLTIRGNNVRLIILPENLPIDAVLMKQNGKIRAPKKISSKMRPKKSGRNR